MKTLDSFTNRILDGKTMTKEEALYLYQQPLDTLCQCADKIRQYFCSNQFDLCTIINGKSGRCSEDCKFCAQSIHNHTGITEYPLCSTEEFLAQAKYNQEQGALRYAIVTSGKRLSDLEVEKICAIVRSIKKSVDISICGSFGLLQQTQFQQLKEAGVSRIHNNLETSPRNFPNICTTHTFQDKVDAIHAAQAVGLSVCSGGIMGLGETIEDRIDMALCLRELGIQSVPINILNPIPGTPFEKNPKLSESEIRRIIAVYRFILPNAFIRLAGGRGLLSDRGKSCFASGANAAISGDMLTTAGITIQTDLKLLQQMGYEVKLCNE